MASGRSGGWTTVLALKRLQEAFQQRRHPLFLAFIDIEKAYDSVPRDALFRLLQERYGVDERALRVMRAMYADVRGQVKVGAATSAPFSISTGVRQGRIPSPLLFAVNLDFLLRASAQECREMGH